jgi:hypothetical protein
MPTLSAFMLVIFFTAFGSVMCAELRAVQSVL